MASRWNWVETIVRVITALVLLGLVLYAVAYIVAYGGKLPQGTNAAWTYGLMLVLLSAAWFTWPRRTRNTP